MASNSETPPNATSSTSQLDLLLQSGQISNAIEFYNYFKNQKSNNYHKSNNNTNYNHNNNDNNKPFKNQNTITSPIPSSSSSSSLSSFSNVSSANNNTNQSRYVAPSNGNQPKRPQTSYTKKSRQQNQQQLQQQLTSPNPLNDYALMLTEKPHDTVNNSNVIKQHQQNQNQIQQQQSNKFKYKKTNNSHLPSSMSSVSIPSNLYALTNNNQTIYQQPNPLVHQFSMYTLEGKAVTNRFYNPNKTTTTPTGKLMNSSSFALNKNAPPYQQNQQKNIHQGKNMLSRKNSCYLNLSSPTTSNAAPPIITYQALNSEMKNRSNAKSNSSIYNQYFIGQQAASSNNPSNSVSAASTPYVTEKSFGDSMNSNGANLNHTNRILASFLDSNTANFYKKYRQNHHESCPKQRKNDMGQKNNENHDDESIDYERRKEDAINRIIHNEKIKQIRQKINEYEMLKEYQTSSFSTSTHSEQLTQSNFETTNPTGMNVMNNKKSTARKQQTVAANRNAKTINAYFNRTYGANSSNRNTSFTSSNDKNLSGSIPVSSQSLSRMDGDVQKFDEYKNSERLRLRSASGASESETTSDLLFDSEIFDDEFFFSTEAFQFMSDEFDENELADLDDSCEAASEDCDNCESGIEDDDETANNNNNHKKSENKRSKKNLGGFQFFKISDSSGGSEGFGGGNIFGVGFNLTSPQSTFQLKVSIISAEVKNIVNVLKQVNKLNVFYFTFTFKRIDLRESIS
jgi:hypothetical protein